MADMTSGLSERDMADLCALADGTLPAERRAEVEARVAASPQLLEFVERQRRSLAATRSLESEPVPASLAAAIEARRSVPRSRSSRRRSLVLALAVAGVLAAVVVAVGILGVGTGSGSPSVAQAAQLAVRPPNEPAPAVSVGGSDLTAAVQGVAFPNYARPFGWSAVGERHGRLGGRDATVVYYVKGGRGLAYAIVAGPALPRPSDAQTTTLGGVQFQTLSLDGRPAVTWQHAGHTCVLIGAASHAELLTLASWP
jgi:anti-sigma factor RsiW